MRQGRILAVLLVVALTVLGCGKDNGGEDPTVTSDAPLHVGNGVLEHPEAGAAGNIVDCRTFGSGGHQATEVYSEGATARSADAALDVARGEGGFGGVQDGLKVAGREKNRVLYVVEVGGRIKQAVIVRNGPATEGAGGDGWYVESWAVCDASELPDSFNAGGGHQIWTDAEGNPVPTSAIESWTGPKHCDWQSMTFLYLGKDVYVRRPIADVRDYYEGSYRDHAALPAGARATGYQHDGDRLWLAGDRKRAFVGTADDVEVWPRLTKPLGCD